MELEYSTNQINELYNIVRQAALHNITDSVLSISFELADENGFHIRLYTLKTAYLNEKKYFEEFHQNLVRGFGESFRVIFEVIEAEASASIYDFQKLKWIFYLPKQ